MGANVSKQEATVIRNSFNSSMTTFNQRTKATAISDTQQRQTNIIRIKQISGNCKVSSNATMNQSVTNQKQIYAKLDVQAITSMVNKMVDDLKMANAQQNAMAVIPGANVSQNISNNISTIVNVVKTQVKQLVSSFDANFTSQVQTNFFEAELCNGNGQVALNPSTFQTVFNKQLLQNSLTALVSAGVLTDAAAKTIMESDQANTLNPFGAGPFGGIMLLVALGIVAFIVFKVISSRRGK